LKLNIHFKISRSVWMANICNKIHFLMKIQVKLRVQFILERARTTQRGRRGKALLFL